MCLHFQRSPRPPAEFRRSDRFVGLSCMVRHNSRAKASRDEVLALTGDLPNEIPRLAEKGTIFQLKSRYRKRKKRAPDHACYSIRTPNVSTSCELQKLLK